MTELITVGDLSRPADELRAYAKTYLQTPGKFAYPAYDGYKGSTGLEIEECDLLAIALLNAGSKPITTFYTLKTLLVPINERLADPRLIGTLTDAGQQQLDAVSDLFGILDEYPSPQVNLTKLAKVLHRKNPELIPLFDRQVRRLYQGRVPRDNKRSYRDFSLTWLPEVQADLRRHSDFWLEITRLANPKVPITPLRAFDIIAWYLGGQSKK